MTFHPTELVIAGWTGRDEAALKKHIRELEEIGVKPPKTTPIFYRVSAALWTFGSSIQVSGPDTSGEVEFVLMKTKDQLHIAVGSDHTDRKAETIGVTLSKQLCAKPVSTESWAYEEVRPHWNRLVLRSFIYEKNQRVLYQEGTVDAMRSPEDLLGRYPLKNDQAMFCGTFAAKGGIRPSPRFEMELEDPVRGRRLSHQYVIHELPVEG
jgi:hypothetical protein